MARSHLVSTFDRNLICSFQVMHTKRQGNYRPDSILFCTFMVLNLCQADSKVQHQNPIQKIIIP